MQPRTAPNAPVVAPNLPDAPSSSPRASTRAGVTVPRPYIAAVQIPLPTPSGALQRTTREQQSIR
jgi:hypothetical protein